MKTPHEQFAGFRHSWDALDSALVEGLLEIISCVLMIVIG
jgi:hypothetical protein